MRDREIAFAVCSSKLDRLEALVEGGALAEHVLAAWCDVCSTAGHTIERDMHEYDFAYVSISQHPSDDVEG